MERKHNRPGLESRPGLAQEEEKTMARKDPGPKADRRRFLTGVVAAGAATAMTPVRSADVAAQAPRVPSALPPSMHVAQAETGTPRELARRPGLGDRKSTRLNSSHSQISYAVFCLKKKKKHEHKRTPFLPHRSIHIQHQAGPGHRPRRAS